MAQSPGGRGGTSSPTAVRTATKSASATGATARATRATASTADAASRTAAKAPRRPAGTGKARAGKARAGKSRADAPSRAGTGQGSSHAAVRGAVRHLPVVPALTARLTAQQRKAIADAIKQPETFLRRARRLPEAAAMLRDAVGPILTGKVDDWRAEYAYTTGLQAFIYGFPYIFNARLRHDWVSGSKDQAAGPRAAVNHFWHATKLADASYRGGGCPSNDVLYSLAWVDVSGEPVILSHPNMANRYFAFELVDFSSDNVDYVGQRSTGRNAGHFAITGPGWKGRLPAGTRKTRPCPTPWVMVLGRTLVDGQQDVANVRALQDQYLLTPLSAWGKPRPKLPRRRAVYKPAEPRRDPLAPWKSLNAMLAENPPPPDHALLLDQFARIGIGPGMKPEAQPDVVRRGLIRAAAVGMPLLREQFLSGDAAAAIDGWRYPAAAEGRFGDDFLRRASGQSLAGIAANDPAEAVHLVGFQDAEGRRLSPKGRYRLRFPPGLLPPADAFWSLTAYSEQDMNMIQNAAGRYSVGDRTPGLKREPDGGLTIYLQPSSPGPARIANWLPTSREHPWFVILRVYRPRRSVAQGSWRCPGLVKVT